MQTNIKQDVRKKARIIKGMANLLVNDSEYICVDADDFDLVSLNQAIPELKDTIQSLIDHVMELEYMLYMTTQKGS